MLPFGNSAYTQNVEGFLDIRKIDAPDPSLHIASWHDYLVHVISCMAGLARIRVAYIVGINGRFK